jgi:hypothetical protein
VLTNHQAANSRANFFSSPSEFRIPAKRDQSRKQLLLVSVSLLHSHRFAEKAFMSLLSSSVCSERTISTPTGRLRGSVAARARTLRGPRG